MGTEERLLSIIERHDEALNGLESTAIARVQSALEVSYKQLERELIRSYNKHSQNIDLLPRQRSLLIADEVQALLQLIDEPAAADIVQSYEEMISGSYAEGFDMAGEFGMAIANNDLKPFSEIPLEAVAAQARDGLRRLKNHTGQFASSASALVEQGLIQGWGARRVTSQLRSQLGATYSKAETIARTETMSALNTAAKQRYARDGVGLIQVMATPSDALCPFCAARNMKVYKADEYLIPSHPRCRCVPLPYSEDWDIDDEFAADYRNRLLTDLEANGMQPDNGLTPFERAAKLDRPPTPIWEPGSPKGRSPQEVLSPVPRKSARERLAQLKNFVASQAPDAIVNTGGVVGSIIGQSFADDAGALAGDLIGALAARQVVHVGQVALEARERLRHNADFQVASRLAKLKQLGASTLSDLKSEVIQDRMGNDLTGDLLGWAIGNASAIALGQIPGLASVPLKGSVVAMQTVPRLQSLRNRIRSRGKPKNDEEAT